MGQSSGKSVNPLKVFEQADCFYQALAVLCNVQPTNIQLGVILGEPVMVMGAFTVELFLKCLICIETGSLPARVHNLKDLLDKLSPDTQAKIRSEWDKIAQHHSATWDRFEKSFGITMARDLEGALTAGGDAFQRIRYSYEGGNETLQYYFQDLPAALGRIILQMKPEWNGHHRDGFAPPSEPPHR